MSPNSTSRSRSPPNRKSKHASPDKSHYRRNNSSRHRPNSEDRYSSHRNSSKARDRHYRGRDVSRSRRDASPNDRHYRESVKRSTSHHKEFHRPDRHGNSHYSGHRSHNRHDGNKEEELMDARRQERERIGLCGVPQIWAKSPVHSERLAIIVCPHRNYEINHYFVFSVVLTRCNLF